MNLYRYLMKGDTIVGYVYQADVHCIDCTHDIAVAGTLAAGSATSWGDSGLTEQILGEWAGLLGIDRDEERTFDSDNFPKVILAYQVEDDYERCGDCGSKLIGDDFNDD